MCVGASKRKSGRVDFFYDYDYIDTSIGKLVEIKELTNTILIFKLTFYF
jgi:hypothetical protein